MNIFRTTKKGILNHTNKSFFKPNNRESYNTREEFRNAIETESLDTDFAKFDNAQQSLFCNAVKVTPFRLTGR